jgi:peptidoglycan/LPS O-acetylase OafA/YrhL
VEGNVEKRFVVAIAAVCLALLVMAQAAFFVYADGQSWWPWNGVWMVLTGALVLAVVAAGRRRDQVVVRSEVRRDDDRGAEGR